MAKRAQVHPEPEDASPPSSHLELTDEQVGDENHPPGRLYCTWQADTVNAQQRKQLWTMVVIALIPIIILAILAAVLMVNSSANNSQLQWVRAKVGGSVQDVGKVAHRMQIERGITSLYIYLGGEKLLSKLRGIYNETDRTIESIHWVYDNDSFSTPSHFRSKAAYWVNLNAFRDNVVSPEYNVTIADVMKFYSGEIETIIGGHLQGIKQSAGEIWAQLISYQLLLIAKEQTGKERALGTTFFSRGGYSLNGDYLWFMNVSFMGRGLLETAFHYSSTLREVYTDTISGALAGDVNKMRDEIYVNDHENLSPSLIKGDRWFDNMTSYIDDLLTLQTHLADFIIRELDADMQGGVYNLVACALLLSTVLITGPVIMRGIIRQTQQIQRVGDSLHRKTLELGEEKMKSDSLLYQMLPKLVAEQLKMTGQAPAETYDEVTVFFSDVVNFTAMSAISSPMQVIVMLNTLYQSLDSLIDRYDVYKVETIGDAYMVVSGAPNRNERRHAPEMAKLALAIYREMATLHIPHLPDDTFELRIGIHTGPCAAGVAGSTRPRYCLFGDTINTASRMESTGEPGRIHISRATREALLRVDIDEGGEEFNVTLRGTLDIKGKGAMTTYWLQPRPVTDNQQLYNRHSEYPRPVYVVQRGRVSADDNATSVIDPGTHCT